MAERKTRNKPSHLPAWIPKFYCVEEMRLVVNYSAGENDTDISKELRAMLNASPLYQKAKENFLLNQTTANETDRTISV